MAQAVTIQTCSCWYAYIHSKTSPSPFIEYSHLFRSDSNSALSWGLESSNPIESYPITYTCIVTIPVYDTTPTNVSHTHLPLVPFPIPRGQSCRQPELRHSSLTWWSLCAQHEWHQCLCAWKHSEIRYEVCCTHWLTDQCHVSPLEQSGLLHVRGEEVWSHPLASVCACGWVGGWVGACEREREREKERVHTSIEFGWKLLPWI